MAATLKVQKWHTRNVCVKLGKGLYVESIVKAPGKSLKRAIIYLLTGFHTGFWVGEEKQDGSRMIVVCESTLTHAYVPTRGSGVWGPPRKILNLDPFRFLLTKSGTRLMFNTCVKTIITYLISRFLGEGVFPAPLPPSVWNTVWLNAPFLYPIMFNFALSVCVQMFHMVSTDVPAGVDAPPLDTQLLSSPFNQDSKM